MHSWNTFNARTNHGQTWTHKIHHGLDLGEATTFPLIVYYVFFSWSPHPNGILSWDSQVGVSKFSQLGLPWLCKPITLHVDLRLKWGLKQSCSLHWEISNNMSHATCTRGNQDDSWLLMVGNQIVNLTPGPSFGHNLCLRCPNGSWELILDIYILRGFQWYKELFNPLSFDPYNHSLKIWESIRTPTPKVEALLEVRRFIPAHFPTLPGACGMTPRLHSWLTTLQALIFVVSPKLGLWQLSFMALWSHHHEAF